MNCVQLCYSFTQFCVHCLQRSNLGELEDDTDEVTRLRRENEERVLEAERIRSEVGTAWTIVGSAQSFVFFIRHNGQWHPTSNDFYTRFYPLLYFPILILEKESVFHSKCWVPNKGTTGTIFIISLVWLGPWLGIEPWTSCTHSQHSTNRLTRRQCFGICYLTPKSKLI